MKLNRLTIFAHYDKDNVIDDYVIFYLKSLKEVSQTVIFVSCCELAECEISKLDGICEHCICEKHDEYDFGSYKRGLNFALNNGYKFDELIFANDSCYGPLFPLSKVFETMESESCDFWGITENKFGIGFRARHIQSYFLVFKKQVFDCEDFVRFVNSVKVQDKKNNVVVNYEIGLSQLLFNKGFCASSYVERYSNCGNLTVYYWRELLKEKLSPFVKTSLLKLQNNSVTTVEGWQNLVKPYDYDISLIENHLKRLNVREINKKVPYKVKRMYSVFYRAMFIPKFLREVVRVFFKNFCD